MGLSASVFESHHCHHSPVQLEYDKPYGLDSIENTPGFMLSAMAEYIKPCNARISIMIVPHAINKFLSNRFTL